MNRDGAIEVMALGGAVAMFVVVLAGPFASGWSAAVLLAVFAGGVVSLLGAVAAACLDEVRRGRRLEAWRRAHPEW